MDTPPPFPAKHDRDRYQRAQPGLSFSDCATALGCGLLAALYALSFFAAWHHHVPINDVYFGADPHRIVANLSSTASDFRRTPFHPFFAALCALFADTRGTNPIALWLQLGCCLYGALVGTLTYLAARLWGASPLWSVGSVLLVAGSGAFAAFSSVPEAHAWGGISILACLIIGSLLPGRTILRVPTAGLLVPLAVSMVFTNLLIWPLCVARAAKLPFTRPKAILDALRDNMLLWISGMAVGLVLLELMFAIELRLFLPNQTLGQLFHFAHDNKYLLAGGHHNPLGGLLAYGFVAPVNGVGRGIGILLACATLLGCTLEWQRRDITQWIRLALPGIALLHTVYDRREAFMCSPNYIALVSILVMITLSRHISRPRYLVLVGAGIVALGALNWFAIAQLRDSLTAAQTFIPL